ncbi:MAG: hypothetical protein ACR2H5_00295 [Ktedonobacteraceae bacterium]
MSELTAEQKIRLAITDHPDGEPEFQHEGETVIRWITTGPEPTAYVRFQERGDQIIAHCPQCGEELGRYNANYESTTYQELREIRTNGVKHQKQHENEQTSTT